MIMNVEISIISAVVVMLPVILLFDLRIGFGKFSNPLFKVVKINLKFFKF